MNMIKHAFLMFLYILACTIIASALYVTLNMNIQDVQLDVMFLWQAIFLSALCALSIFIYYSKHELSKRQHLVRRIIHFIVINVIMLFGSIYFEWIASDKLWNIIFMLLLIISVYLIVTFAVFLNNKAVANQLNVKLKQLNKPDEDEI